MEKATFVKKRMLKAYLIMAIAIFIIIGRVGYWQIVQGELLKEEAFNQQTRDFITPSVRGNILDRNGKKLAASVKLKSVECITKYLKDKKVDYEEYSKKISEILEMDKDEVYSILTSDKKYPTIKRWISHKQAEELKKADLKGIVIYKDTKRTYPYDSLASQILGNTDKEGNGKAGIEMKFNEYLKGIPGRSVKIMSDHEVELPYTDSKIIKPIDGYNVVLTIDEVIQNYIEKIADETMMKHRAKNVSIIVMEPKSGEILGMASKPDYNPNNRIYLNYDPVRPWLTLNENDLKRINSIPWNEKKDTVLHRWKSSNISMLYDPGSTFKLITAASALEENIVNLNETYNCDGFTHVDGQRIRCWIYPRKHGEQTLYEAIQNSCNPALVEIATRLNKENFYKYMTDFGYGKYTAIDLLDEVKGIVTIPENMNNVELATISFGQGITATPMQVLTSISSFANDGSLMKPMIVKKLTDSNNKVIKTYEPETIKKVVSKQTADTMLDILESVVTDGTGKSAHVNGYRVGGKSGTSQKLIDGKYGDKYIASFVAVAPINNPKISVLVVVDEPQSDDDHGGAVAGPVVKEIIQHTLHHLGVRPEHAE